MTDRFFLWEPPDGDRCLLTKEESHHFLRVMRGRPGDELILFSGEGWEALGRATGTRGGRVEVEILERSPISREAEVALDMAVAIPKGRRMEGMIRALAEMGVRRVFPVIPLRGSVRPRPSAGTRWRKVVVEAAKQCGRNVLMEVEEPRPLPDLLPSLPERSLRLLPHPEAGETLAHLLGSVALPSSVISLIGPEGGFAPAEVGAAIAAGFRTVRLAPSILRLETAACAVAAAILIARPGPPTAGGGGGAAP